FFELDSLTTAIRALGEVAPKLGDAQTASIPGIVEHLRALKQLIDDQAEALMQKRVLQRPVAELIAALRSAVEGHAAAAAPTVPDTPDTPAAADEPAAP